MSVFKLEAVEIASSQYLAFISTGLSIIILVFSQSESSSDYGLKAEKFHNCAIEISDLYDKMRYLKTNQATEIEVNKFSQELAIEYGTILKRYENHKSIDFDYFKISKTDYFKLTKRDVLTIRLKYF